MKIVPPTVALHDSWLEAYRFEDLREGHGMSLELAGDADLADPRAFAEWVVRLQEEEHTPLPGRVSSTNRWLVEDDTFLGAIQLRHHLGTEYLRTRGGHVGYTVRSSSRGKGIATRALLLLLPEAKRRGIEKVLVTCLETNPASARVIEKAGGVYEGTVNGLRRYWIAVDRPQ